MLIKFCQFHVMMTVGPQNVVLLICTIADIRSQRFSYVYNFFFRRPLVRETGFWAILQKSLRWLQKKVSNLTDLDNRQKEIVKN